MFSIGWGEFLELSKSTLIVALVFTIASQPGWDPLLIVFVFAVAALCAGAGFILHELMHKAAAQAMGYRAEYRAGGFPYMSLLFAFAGWILLSPGAVRVTGITKPLSGRANGIISLAGPATNLALALAFYSLSGFGSLIGEVGRFGYSINIYLAMFNMVPASGFDGHGVWGWNKGCYAAFAAVAAILFFTL